MSKMTFTFVLAASLLAQTLAWHFSSIFAESHHMRGAGMWHRFQHLLGGTGVVDLREAESCCAMHRDGSYYANSTVIADFGGGVELKFATQGIDAAGLRFIGFAGGDGDGGADDSDYGVYLRPLNATMVATAWCSAARACKDFAFPAAHALPTMCFGGEDSMWPSVVSSSRVDAMISTNNFADARRSHFIAVNRLTCMPLYALHRFNASDDDAAHASMWRAFRAAVTPPGNGSSHSGGGGETWVVNLFLNATGTPPPDDVFRVPSYCDTAASRTGK